MKMYFKKAAACLCAAVMTAALALPMPTVPTAVAAATADPDLVLHYDSPAGTKIGDNAWDNGESFYKALPAGNGRIGAMVYGNCPTERFDLNESTFWSGNPGSNNRQVSSDTMEHAWQQMLAGDYPGADNTIGMNMIGGGMAKFQSVGTLNIDTGHRDVAGYERHLDMNTGTVGSSYSCGGKQYSRETFVSHPDQVMVTRISCSDAGGVSLTASYDCSLTGQFSVETDGDDTLVMNGHGDGSNFNPGAIHFSTRTKVIPEGGTVSAGGGKVSVTGADSVTIITSIRTNFIDFETVNGDEKGMAAADIAAASKKSYKELYDAYEADYTELFDRCRIELGGDGSNNNTPIPSRIASFGRDNDPKLCEVLFQYGRYMTISASRDSEPMNLQGIWNKFRNPAWDCKYTTNINYEMNYWPALTTNLEECFRPFVEKAKSLQKQGNLTAREVYGVSEGWVVHHNTDIWNHTGPIDGAWGMWPTGAAWICDMLYDAYNFNQDEEYLAEVYPVIKGSAEFLNAILREATIDGQTYDVVFPSTSPEVNAPAYSGGKGAACAYGIAMDNSLARALFRDTVSAAEALGLDSTLSNTLRGRLNNLKPDTIGSWGQIQEWAYDWDDKGEKNRHISHMYSLFPGEIISKGNAPELAAAAAVSLNARGDEGTGWSEGWKLNCWARLEDGAHAYNVVKLLVSPVDNYGRLYDNLWDAHPPFQIDGNFGFTSGVAEMLLQSHAGEIKLLPALPEQWNTGYANGLCARGGFEVNQTWKNGQLTEAEILSKNGNVCTVSYQGQTVTFPTEKGKTYLLSDMLDLDGASPMKNVAFGKTVSASDGDAAAVVDGSEGSAWTGKGAGWVSVDLGKKYEIGRWVVKLGGTSGKIAQNARDFRLQISEDGETWTDLDQISGNTVTTVGRNLTPVTTQYARVLFDTPAQTDNGDSSLAELELWGISDEPEPTRSAYDVIEAETYNRQSGVQIETLDDGGKDVGFIENGDYIAFRNIDFGSGAETFTVKAGSETEGGTISLRLDAPDGKEIGACKVTGTEGWTEWKTFECDVTGAEGLHTLYLVFTGDDGFLINLDQFRFATTIPQTTAADTTAPAADTTTTTSGTKAETEPAGDTTAPKKRTPGDVNEDSKVTVADAILLARIVAEDGTAKVSDQGKLNGDVDGESGLSPNDTTLVLKYIAGIEKELK